MSLINRVIKNNRPVGILGGTFDPIHYGHLFIAETAMEELQLEKIIFIPNRISPHKMNVEVTDAYHRLIMTEIATSDHEDFSVSPIEIHREGPSFTFDTINQLINENPPGTTFYFITGTDVLLEIETWRNYEELLKLIKFSVVTRAGFDYQELDDKIAYLKERFGSEIIKIPIPNLEISSTDIRKRVEMGRSIKYLVPEGVREYINRHGMYGLRGV